MPTPGPYEHCPCRSGKKYKFCCLTKDREAAEPVSKQASEGDGVPLADGTWLIRRGDQTYRSSHNMSSSDPVWKLIDEHYRSRRRGR